ncbi:tyrosine-protein kinase JAK1-like isoform X1 [Mytilus galloprovincialis]|uniref:tyrosine-protein kinase JAK1-like isoform X1 n=1 Tax=Mytilus galloprovincialis TaxID=29158 RepID=UPI003F7BDB0A
MGNHHSRLRQSGTIYMRGIGNDQYQSVNIKLHGIKTDNYNVPTEDFSLPVQDLCYKLLQDRYPAETIGPAAIHLFGLACFDQDRKTCTWLNPRKSLSDSMKDGFRGLNNLYLRIRFLPVKSQLQGHIIQSLCYDKDRCPNHVNYLIHYLFFQVKNDFVSDRLNTFYGELVQSSKARGNAVLDLVIMSRLYGLDSPENVFDHIDHEKNSNCCCYFGKMNGIESSLNHVLPSRERNNCWKDYKLEKNMKATLTEYSKENRAATTVDLMVHYIQELMMDVRERYISKRAEMEGKVEITVNTQNGFGVFIREQSDRSVPSLFCAIDELQSIDIHHDNYMMADKKTGNNNMNKSWTVRVHRTNGTPLMLIFDTVETAESFISGLDGYYRVIHNYHHLLCDQVAPHSLKQLANLKCHGPISEKLAVEKLKKSDHEFFIVKQDIHKQDKFAIVYTNEGQIRTKYFFREDDKFFLEGDTSQSYNTTRELFKALSESGILAKTPIIVRPKNECCEVLKNLFVNPSDTPNTEDEDSGVIAKKKQPLVYMQGDIMTDEKLGNGYFTEVYKGRVRGSDKFIAVKQIRHHRPKERNQELLCYESLQMGICRQLGFEDNRFFVGIQGLCLTSPSQVVEEYAQYGSLAKFFDMRKPFTLQHFIYIAIQLAEALLYMDEKNLHHGSICCKNVMVFKYDAGDIFIKLADSGMLNIYNKLPIGHVLNTKRLPWVAPELFKDMSKMTISGDVYAFSTTLWECATLGRSPLEVQPLKDFNLDSDKIQEFYLSGKTIDFPEDLITKGDEGRSRATNSSANSSYNGNTKCTNPSDRDSNEVRTNDCEENESEAKLPDYSKVNNGQRTSSVLDPEEHIYSTGYSSTSSTDRNVKIKRTVTDIMAKCWAKAEDRIETNIILRDLRNVHSGYVDHEYHREYSEINESDMESFTPSPDQLERAFMKDIPNIMQYLECDTNTHWTAEDMRVNLKVNQTSPPPAVRRGFTEPCREKLFHNNKLLDFKFLIDSKRLKLQGRIGSGHYGEVKRGYLSTSAQDPSSQRQQVAVKVLKEDRYQSVMENEEFRNEAELMSTLRHDNIVRFIGVSDNMLVMEYIEKGCMRDYLKKKKKEKNMLSVTKILRICADIADGMAYLSSKRILHCDLAARNVLLSSEIRAKISDFGLAKLLDKEKDYYKRSENKNLPAWWCSPEALSHRKFSHKADVWSYGVVLWEGFTHSDSPKVCSEVKHLMSSINGGKRLPKPDLCPADVYTLMNLCWRHKPEERPDFSEVHKRCRELIYIHQQNREETAVARRETVSSNNQSYSQNTESNSSQSDRSSQRVVSDSSNQSEELSEAKEVHLEHKDKIKETVHNISSQAKLLNKKPIDNAPKDTNNSDEKIPGPITRSPETKTRTVTHNSKALLSLSIPNSAAPSHQTGPASASPSPPRPTVSGHQMGVVGTSLPPTPLVLMPPATIPLNYLLEKKCIHYNDNNLLGAGNFGVVYKGTLRKNGRDINVAIKTLKEKSVNSKEEIETEVKILEDLDHPNIVKFYGFCRTDCLLVMELVDNGTLVKHLQKCKHEKVDLETKKLLNLCLGVAEGMKYLAERSIIHCDLAGRNVLLTNDLTTKISDFGLAKLLQEKAYYRRSGDKKMNVHWCSPEFFQERKLSTQSDIWSYGIVLWEIFSYGKHPNICGTDTEMNKIAEFIINKGCHLEKPEQCPDHVYLLMKDCWQMEPKQRPSFSGLVQTFQSYFSPVNDV